MSAIKRPGGVACDRPTIEPAPIPGKRFVQLTRGKWATVDEADFAEARKYIWHAFVTGTGKSRTYASSMMGVSGGFCMLLHRLVLQNAGVVSSQDTKLDIDHINGDGLDCSRSNLRLVTRSQNLYNRRASKLKKKSKYKGVSTAPGGRWGAGVGDIYAASIKTKTRHLGCFKTEVDAAECYDEAARHYFGEFACVNFPKTGERGCL